jgi:hypothetical protein
MKDKITIQPDLEVNLYDFTEDELIMFSHMDDLNKRCNAPIYIIEQKESEKWVAYTEKFKPFELN